MTGAGVGGGATIKKINTILFYSFRKAFLRGMG